MEEDIENTTGRLVVTTKRIKALIRKSNSCKLWMAFMITFVVLILIIVLALKLAPLAALG